MVPEKDLVKVDKWERIPLLCGVFAVSAGLIALLGWCFDIGPLRAFLSDGVNMKVNTAQLLVLSGLSLILLQTGYLAIARTLLIVIQVFSLAIVYEHLSGTDLYIDQLIFRDHFITAKLEAPGRTSLLTALYLILSSSAMLLTSFKRYYAAQFAGATLIVLVYISLLGHLFHFGGLYFPAGYSELAFHTAFTLLALAVGTVILKPYEGWITVVYQHFARKNLLIYLLSYVLAAAPLFAAIYLFVIKNSTIAPASDMLVLFILTLILSVPVAYFLLRLFKQLDEDVRGAHEQLRIAVHASGLGVWDLNLEKGALSHSDKFAQFFGDESKTLTTTEALWSAFHPLDAVAGKAAFKEALTSGQVDFQARIILEDGRIRWIQFYGETQRDRSGAPVRLLGTAMDITVRKELEQQKDEFISVASHELKTPLTSLKTYVQVAHNKAKVLEDPKIAGMLERAEIQINKMTRLISDFLNAAQSEAGKMILQKQEFFLDDLIRDVIADLTVNLKDRNVMLNHCPHLKINADREKIEQVLVNLIGNAIKYSIGNEPIILICYEEDRRALVRVEDRGIGISDADKLHLFDRFYRAENPNTRTVSGFGIGLYLSAEIVRLHGGKIGVDSEIGKGSSFWFNLPVMTSASNTAPEFVLK